MKKISKWYAVPTGLILLSSQTHVLAGGAYSSDDDFFEAAAEFIETTDDYAQRSLKASYKKEVKATGVNYGIRSQANHFRDDHKKFKGHEIAIHAGKKIGESAHIEAGVGTSHVEDEYGYQEKTETSYYLQGKFKPNKKVEVKLRHEHDLAYKNRQLINQYGKILSEDVTTAEINVRPTEKIRLHAKTQHSELSDDNRANEHKVGAYYAVLPEWPYAEVGVEGSQINYEKQDDGYWTPDNYRAVSLVGSLSMPVSKKVDLSTSAVVTRSKEDGVDGYSTGGYASVGATFKLNKQSSITAQAHHISSAQDGSSWTENGLMTRFNYRF